MIRSRLLIELPILLLLAGLSLAAINLPSQQRADTPPEQFSSTVVADLRLDESAKPQAETLSYIIQAGEVLIFNLPENLGTRKVESYSIKQAPALSWLVKRSFFWRTLATDVGEHEILLNALANGSAVESLVVEVEIR